MESPSTLAALKSRVEGLQASRTPFSMPVLHDCPKKCREARGLDNNSVLHTIPSFTQELLDNTTTETPQKLAEVVRMSREMAELQKMAAELRGSPDGGSSQVQTIAPLTLGSRHDRPNCDRPTYCCTLPSDPTRSDEDDQPSYYSPTHRRR